VRNNVYSHSKGIQLGGNNGPDGRNDSACETLLQFRTFEAARQRRFFFCLWSLVAAL
jgi:hypothetical protein